MIFYDSYGLPVDVTGDGGDTAMRLGMLAVMGLHVGSRCGDLVNNGVAVRHPYDVPWNNPNNFTRDQLIPLISGLYQLGKYEEVRLLFKAHAKRFFFCQNIERDYPGSRKYPYPHTFINDRGDKETRLFDYADWIFPIDVVYFALCCNYYPKLLRPLGIFLFFFKCLFKAFKDPLAEENQMICMSMIYGRIAKRIFKFFRPQWKASSEYYWGIRNEINYHNQILKVF